MTSMPGVLIQAKPDQTCAERVPEPCLEALAKSNRQGSVANAVVLWARNRKSKVLGAEKCNEREQNVHPAGPKGLACLVSSRLPHAL